MDSSLGTFYKYCGIWGICPKVGMGKKDDNINEQLLTSDRDGQIGHTGLHLGTIHGV